MVGLGFNIRGGTDNMHVGTDPGIFVTTIRPAGAAAVDGRLQTGDKILELNGENLRAVPHKKAVSAFHRCGETITLLVEKGAEQRIRDQQQAESSPNTIYPPQDDEEAEDDQPRANSLVVLIKQWYWLPLLLGGVSVLLLYVRRRPHSFLSRLFRRR
jgi:hypothetical protein